MQSEPLAAAETRGEIEDDHRAERIVEFPEQEMELSNAEDNRFAAAFARAPDADELHGILTDFVNGLSFGSRILFTDLAAAAVCDVWGANRPP